MEGKRVFLQALRRNQNYSVTALDLAGESIEKQVEIVSQTDILIGMHGAGLTHLLFLKTNAALSAKRSVEAFIPPQSSRFQCKFAFKLLFRINVLIQSLASTRLQLV